EQLLARTDGFTARRMASADAVRAAVASQAVTAGLIVPSDFAPQAGRRIELSIDEGEAMQVRGPIAGALTGVVMRALAPAMAAMPAVLEPRTPPGLAPPLAQVSGFQVAVP